MVRWDAKPASGRGPVRKLRVPENSAVLASGETVRWETEVPFRTLLYCYYEIVNNVMRVWLSIISARLKIH